MDEFFDVSSGKRFAIIEGVLPTSDEWKRIESLGMGINVLSMPERAPSLEALRPVAHLLTHVLINSGSCRDLRLLAEMSNLELLGVGGEVEMPVDVTGLSQLRHFSGPHRSFPGILDHPALQSLHIDWKDSTPPTIGAPLVELVITNAQRMRDMPKLGAPHLLRDLTFHGSRDLDLRGIGLFTHLRRLMLDHCGLISSCDELLSLQEIEQLILEDCPRIEPYWSLWRLRETEVRVVGRNPFPLDFRDVVAGARWTFPQGKRFIPSEASSTREFLAHPGLVRALRVPEEASENMPWLDELTPEWLRLSEREKTILWESFLENLLGWASAEGAEAALGSRGVVPLDVPSVVAASRHGAIEVQIGSRQLLTIPEGRDGGVFITSSSTGDDAHIMW